MVLFKLFRTVTPKTELTHVKDISKRLDVIERQMNLMRTSLFELTGKEFNPFYHHQLDDAKRIDEKVSDLEEPAVAFLNEMMEKQKHAEVKKKEPITIIEEEEPKQKIELEKEKQEIKDEFYMQVGTSTFKARRVEAPAPEGKEFFLQNGKVAKDINELYIHIKQSEPDTYYMHVDTNRNDFAEWVANVFEENELAEKIRTSETRDDFLQKIETQLK